MDKKNTGLPTLCQGLPWWLSIKNLPAMQKTLVRSLGREDPLEKKMKTHSNILAQEIPWSEQTGRIQSMGSQESDMTKELNSNILCQAMFQMQEANTLLSTTNLVFCPNFHNLTYSQTLFWGVTKKCLTIKLQTKCK